MFLIFFFFRLDKLSSLRLLCSTGSSVLTTCKAELLSFNVMSNFGLLLSSMPLISTDGILAQQILDKVFMELDDTGYISTTWVFLRM